MIKLEDVDISFGDRTILDQATWTLGDNDRVGLVGENGSGKTTLLRAMAGLQEVDRGRVIIPRGVDIGYLPQSGAAFEGRSLEEEVREAARPLLHLLEEHRRLEERMPTVDDPAARDSMLLRMTELMDQFQFRDGYQVESRIARVLKGLGFKDEDRDRPVQAFSGGWQMRIALAKLLIAQPDTLLLDEPTNHLDLEARNWLEEYLNETPAAFVIVSHDRYFLDVTVKKTLEIEDGALTVYHGNYSYYLAEKERRLSAQITAYEKRDDEIQRHRAFINKYRADKKRAGQVQSRIKMLDRLKPLELPRVKKRARISLPPAPTSPLEMARLSAAAAGYDGLKVFEDADLVILRGEKMAVVGPNGSGKSTLLKALAGKLKLEQGSLDISNRVEIAYFDQVAGDALDPSLTVLETISGQAPLDMFPQLRDILGAFLFRGDEVDKKVGDLSGGEKSRLALALMLLKPANLLLLDEPTNHLDLMAKETLMEAFLSYQGALVFVAHDRYFLEKLPDRTIEVKDGRVTSYIGDYRDYLRARARVAPGSVEAIERTAPAEAKENFGSPGDELRLLSDKELRIKKREQEKARKKLEQKKKRRLGTLEREIAEAEEELERLAAEMSDPQAARDYQKLMDLEKERASLGTRLEQLIAEWESLGKEQGGPDQED